MASEINLKYSQAQIMIARAELSRQEMARNLAEYYKIMGSESKFSAASTGDFVTSIGTVIDSERVLMEGKIADLLKQKTP